MKSRSSSFLIHLSNLLTELMAADLVTKGPNTAYSSNPDVTWRDKKAGCQYMARDVWFHTRWNSENSWTDRGLQKGNSPILRVSHKSPHGKESSVAVQSCGCDGAGTDRGQTIDLAAAEYGREPHRLDCWTGLHCATCTKSAAALGYPLGTCGNSACVWTPI